MTAVLLILGLALYFAPAIVATRKRHPQETAITTLNLFLGWTLIGWVVALVWAVSKSTPRPVIVQTVAAAEPERRVSEADELERFASLRDRGVITNDEFDAKKRAILG